MILAASQPDFVDVRLAAFGTLSNGSDVRLLARPAEGDLSDEAKATIEAVFYAAWKAVGTRRAPYFLFTPLDSELWGLCQVRQLGRGAIGEVLVVWVALLDSAQLDSIGWATHRLFYSAFPDAAGLPAPNTRLPIHRAQILKDRSPEVQAYDPAFDQVAYHLVPDPNRITSWRAQIIVEPPADPGLTRLSAEGVLFGLFDRLGKWRNDISYCTWAGLQAFGFPRTGEAFNLIVSDTPTDVGGDIPNRKVFRLGAGTNTPGLSQPSPKWRAIREHAGVQETTRERSASPVASSAADDDDLADLLFTLLRPNLLGNAPVAELARVANDLAGSDSETDELRAKCLPLVLVRALEARGETPPSRAQSIDRYIEQVLPILEDAFSDQRHRLAVASLATDLGLLPYLSRNSIDLLARELFGDAANSGLTDQIVPRVPTSAQRDGSNWSAVLGSLRDHEDGPGRERLLPLLIAQAFSDPQTATPAEEALVSFVVAKGIAAALPILQACTDPTTRRSVFVKLASRRAPTPTRDSWERHVSDRFIQFQLWNAGEALARARRSRG